MARHGRLLVTLALTLVLAGVILFGAYRAVPVPTADGPSRGKLLASVYDPPQTRAENMLVQGDGQVFAAHALDPTVQHPERIRGGPGEQAYRLQRPLYGWLAWAASGGRADAVPGVLFGMTIGSVVALVGAIALLLIERGADPMWALVVVAAPGVRADLTLVGPEALGGAIVLLGLWSWRRGNTGPARVAFAVAGLCRETLLVVPLAVALSEVVPAASRGMAASISAVRGVLPLLASTIPLIAWLAALHGTTGSWPVGSQPGRLAAVPFGGLAQGLGAGSTAAYAGAATLVLAIAALRVAPRSIRWVIGAHVVLASMLGPAVWSTDGIGRFLLPLAAVTTVALGAWAGTGTQARTPSPAADGAGDVRISAALDHPAR